MGRKIESLNYLIEKDEAEKARAAKDLKDHRIITRLNLDSEKDPALVAHAEREGVPLSNIEDWQQEVEGLARVRQFGRDIRAKYREVKTKLVSWLAPDRKSNITTIFGQEGYHPKQQEVVKAQQDVIAAINTAEAAAERVDSEVDRLVRAVKELHGVKTGLRKVEGPFERVTDEEDERDEEVDRLVASVKGNHPRTGLREVTGPFERVTDEDEQETIVRPRVESREKAITVATYKDVARIIEESIPLQRNGKKKKEFYADLPPMYKELRRSPGSPSRESLERARDVLRQIIENKRTTPENKPQLEAALTFIEKKIEALNKPKEDRAEQVVNSAEASQVNESTENSRVEAQERTFDTIAFSEIADLIEQYKSDKIFANSYKETLNKLRSKKVQPNNKTAKNALYLVNRMLAMGAGSSGSYSEEVVSRLEQARYTLEQELVGRRSKDDSAEVESSPEAKEAEVVKNNLEFVVEQIRKFATVKDTQLAELALSFPPDGSAPATLKDAQRAVSTLQLINQRLPDMPEVDSKRLEELKVKAIQLRRTLEQAPIAPESKAPEAAVVPPEIKPGIPTPREEFDLVSRLAEPLNGGVDEISLERAIVNPNAEQADKDYAIAYVEQILKVNPALTEQQKNVLGPLLNRLQLRINPATKARVKGAGR